MYFVDVFNTNYLIALGLNHFDFFKIFFGLLFILIAHRFVSLFILLKIGGLLFVFEAPLLGGFVKIVLR